MVKFSSILCVAAILLAGCNDHDTKNATPEARPAPEIPPAETSAVEVGEKPAARLGRWGVDTDNMNTDIAPGDDFFRHVNGKWLDTFVIPDDFSTYSSFTVLFERAEDHVRAIIEETTRNGGEGDPTAQKIGDFYASYLDADKISTLGLDPIEEDFALIDAAEDHGDIARLFGTVGLAGNAPVAGYVDIDAKNPGQYRFYFLQAGLGMPNKAYYEEAIFADKRTAYRDFLETMLAAVDIAPARRRAAALYSLEERMAQMHWAPEKRRNRDLTYNPYTLAELKAYAGDFPWDDMLRAAGLEGEGEFILRENDAIQGLAKVFRETPVAVWQDYLKVHYLINYAEVLPRMIDEVVFAFFETELRGVEAQKERWKRGVASLNNTLGEAIGEIYVTRHFPPEAKTQMDLLVKNVKAAFATRIDQLDWMSDATKAEAHAKLENFTTKIGYPENWTDYTTLTITPGDAHGNKKRAAQFSWREMISKLGGPIDTDEWFLTPQTVNAYYSPTRNEIVFPAAILQAPFFDPHADVAVNYGAIGAVIGHEISHGFDDQGRKSDGHGVLRNWWSEEDATRFNAKAAILGAQFGQYAPVEGHSVNPDLTMGENIGDLGGLTVALEAYRLSLGEGTAEILDGYSGEQRLFLSWAQVWQGKYREDALKQRLATDPHAPPQYRTNGIVRNMDAWYSAFDVTPDHALYLAPEDRVRIW